MFFHYSGSLYAALRLACKVLTGFYVEQVWMLKSLWGKCLLVATDKPNLLSQSNTDFWNVPIFAVTEWIEIHRYPEDISQNQRVHVNYRNTIQSDVEVLTEWETLIFESKRGNFAERCWLDYHTWCWGNIKVEDKAFFFVFFFASNNSSINI